MVKGHIFQNQFLSKMMRDKSSIGLKGSIFYRRDSNGEGGSGVLVLGNQFINAVVDKMPGKIGLIITDGSNSGNHLFGHMNRPTGIKRFGCLVQPTEIQPFEQHGLRQIRVTPIVESS